jgi:hypothetical protein
LKKRHAATARCRPRQGRRKRNPETLLLVHADVSRLFYEFTAPLGIFGFLGSCNADGPAFYMFRSFDCENKADILKAQDNSDSFASY